MRELAGFGERGAGHAAELLVHAEVVLQRDRRERLVLFFDLDALFGLDRLVQPFAPAATFENATRELVDDLHLAVVHEVVDVALEELFAAQRLRELVHVVLVNVLVEVLDAQRFFDARDAFLGRHNGALRLVDLVVAVALQGAGDAGELVVELGRVGSATRDDERRARLVDEDRVDLVDDRKVVRRPTELARTELHLLFDADDHVVAQVVEAELVVRAVDDVGRVDCALLVRRGVVGDDRADGQPEEPVQASHPFGVASREVVVHGHDVDTAPGKRVQVRGQRGGERLAFAGLHLGDPAEMQCGAAHHLHVEVALAEDALACFPDDGKRFGE